MASVWVARLVRKHGFEKLVAIKTILPKYAEDETFQKMFFDEARIASRIDHANVGHIHDLGEEGGIVYLVMEWIDGDALTRLRRAINKAKVPFPADIALRIIADVCAGLHAAHELKDADGATLGVVHRDVSPQNILITVEGVAKLIDFGVAKARDRLIGETNTGFVKGKVQYMAPEQALGKNVDRRADLWAVGAVLYHLLANRPPFEAENQLAMLHVLTSGNPPAALPPRIPSRVVEVVERALTHDPDKRFQTAAEMRSAIERSGLAATTDDVAECLRTYLGAHAEARRQALAAALQAAGARASLVPSSSQRMQAASTGEGSTASPPGSAPARAGEASAPNPVMAVAAAAPGAMASAAPVAAAAPPIPLIAPALNARAPAPTIEMPPPESSGSPAAPSPESEPQVAPASSRPSVPPAQESQPGPSPAPVRRPSIPPAQESQPALLRLPSVSPSPAIEPSFPPPRASAPSPPPPPADALATLQAPPPREPSHSRPDSGDADAPIPLYVADPDAQGATQPLPSPEELAAHEEAERTERMNAPEIDPALLEHASSESLGLASISASVEAAQPQRRRELLTAAAAFAILVFGAVGTKLAFDQLRTNGAQSAPDLSAAPPPPALTTPPAASSEAPATPAGGAVSAPVPTSPSHGTKTTATSPRPVPTPAVTPKAATPEPSSTSKRKKTDVGF
jgi:serine/threonine-protein kinase